MDVKLDIIWEEFWRNAYKEKYSSVILLSIIIETALNQLTHLLTHPLRFWDLVVVKELTDIGMMNFRHSLQDVRKKNLFIALAKKTICC